MARGRDVKRIIVRVIAWTVVAAAALFFLLGGLSKLSAKAAPPTPAQARFELQTSTRVFYARQLRMNGKTPEIRYYYELEGKKYVYYESVLPLPSSVFGHVTVIDRASASTPIPTPSQPNSGGK